MPTAFRHRSEITTWQVLRCAACLLVLGWWGLVLCGVAVDLHRARIVGQVAAEARKFARLPRVSNAELHTFVARRLARRGLEDRRFALNAEANGRALSIRLLDP